MMEKVSDRWKWCNGGQLLMQYSWITTLGKWATSKQSPLHFQLAAKEGKMVIEIEKGGSLTGFPGPQGWCLQVYFCHKMECYIFRYHTWYAVVAGRTGSICAFAKKYILHGDSSWININSVNWSDKIVVLPRYKYTQDSRGPQVGSEWGMGVRNWSIYATHVSID